MTISKIRVGGTDHDLRAKYLETTPSSEAKSVEFYTRSTTEEATVATVQKIYGNTIKWNQIADLSRVMAYNGSSISASGTTGIWTVTATGRNQGLTVMIGSATINHKYYVSYYVKTTAATDFRIGSYNQAGNGSEVSINGIGYVDAILTQTETVTDQRFMGIVRTSSYSGTFDMGLPMVVDLTDIYGAGNEPTIAQFKTQYPIEYSSYFPLNLSSLKAVSIQAKDSNSNIIGSSTLNITSLTGKLNGAGISVTVFSDGMKKAGAARDEIEGNIAKRKTQKYTFTGTEDWKRAADGYYYLVAVQGLNDGTQQPESNYYTGDVGASGFPATDKHIKLLNGSFGLAVHEDTCTTADSFKQYLVSLNSSNAPLVVVIPIATPQEYILDNALQLQYPVVAGGTESIVPSDPSLSAPIKMDVIYGNAADTISNLPANYISVDSMKDFLSALGTQMNGTWSMQYADGKYTFTFTSN